MYLGSTEGPMFLAIAAPQVFVRPGAGVSRLPLEVAAFGAPGFGDVQDAINLASGNVSWTRAALHATTSSAVRAARTTKPRTPSAAPAATGT